MCQQGLRRDPWVMSCSSIASNVMLCFSFGNQPSVLELRSENFDTNMNISGLTYMPISLCQAPQFYVARLFLSNLIQAKIG